MINAHDDSDPEELVNRLDAELEAVATRYEFCGDVATVTPALGTRYVLGIDHKPGPEYLSDNDLPCVVVPPRHCSE